jgi:hypothetical protein
MLLPSQKQWLAQHCCRTADQAWFNIEANIDHQYSTNILPVYNYNIDHQYCTNVLPVYTIKILEQARADVRLRSGTNNGRKQHWSTITFTVTGYQHLASTGIPIYSTLSFWVLKSWRYLYSP